MSGSDLQILAVKRRVWAGPLMLGALTVTGLVVALADVTRCMNTAQDQVANRRRYFKHAYSYLSDFANSLPADYQPLRD
jgi:hypothetical protein